MAERRPPCPLAPIQAIRSFVKLRGLTFRKGRRAFHAEVLEGRHSPEGIRHEFSETERLMPGTYPGGDGEGYIRVYRSFVREPIPRDFLGVADAEEGFDYEADTITAHEIRYRNVTYLLDDEATSATAGAPPPAQEDAAAAPLTSKQDREQLLKRSQQLIDQFAGKIPSREEAILVTIDQGLDPRTTALSWDDLIGLIEKLCPYLPQIKLRRYEQLVRKLRPIS